MESKINDVLAYIFTILLLVIFCIRFEYFGKSTSTIVPEVSFDDSIKVVRKYYSGVLGSRCYYFQVENIQTRELRNVQVPSYYWEKVHIGDTIKPL